MKTPTWAILIAIFMVFFGGCDVVSNISSIYANQALEKYAPALVRASAKLLDSIKIKPPDSVLNIRINDDVVVTDTTFSGLVDKLSNIESDETGFMSVSEQDRNLTLSWLSIGVFAGFFYLLAGFLLMGRTKISIRFAYSALGFTALVTIVQIILSILSPGLVNFSVSTSDSGVFGIIIDIAFIVLIYMSDKSAYPGYESEIKKEKKLGDGPQA